MRRATFDRRMSLRLKDLLAEWALATPTCPADYRVSLLFTAFIDGGEGGIRTLSTLVESATYRFHIADDARNASVAVGPCSFLPDGCVAERPPPRATRMVDARRGRHRSSGVPQYNSMCYILFHERR